MNEFRKEYEYEEETKGLIQLFIGLILAVDSFIVIAYMTQVSHAADKFPAIKYGYLLCGIFYIIYLFYTIWVCYKMKLYLVVVSKIYLWIRVIFSTLGMIIIYRHADINYEKMIGSGVNEFESRAEMISAIVVGPSIYMIIFTLLWFVYFTYSKRCREITRKYKESGKM